MYPAGVQGEGELLMLFKPRRCSSGEQRCPHYSALASHAVFCNRVVCGSRRVNRCVWRQRLNRSSLPGCLYRVGCRANPSRPLQVAPQQRSSRRRKLTAFSALDVVMQPVSGIYMLKKEQTNKLEHVSTAFTLASFPVVCECRSVPPRTTRETP